MTPDATLNAAWSLSIPIAVALLAAQLDSAVPQEWIGAGIDPERLAPPATPDDVRAAGSLGLTAPQDLREEMRSVKSGSTRYSATA